MILNVNCFSALFKKRKNVRFKDKSQLFSLTKNTASKLKKKKTTTRKLSITV